jgi:hypothetical protein
MWEWGGWDSIAKLVAENPSIPFQFTGADVKAVLSPNGQIAARSSEEIDRLLNIWSFYATLRKEAPNDSNVQKFYNDVTKRVEHGCWKSIADLVNNNEKIPFKGFTVPDLKTVLDPQGMYGDDPECALLAPPSPPAWVIPIVWTMTAAVEAKDWTVNAGEDVANWTLGAAGSVTDWTLGAATDAGDWTTKKANEVGTWTTGVASDTADWATGAAKDTGNWAKDAASTVATVFNPSRW